MAQARHGRLAGKAARLAETTTFVVRTYRTMHAIKAKTISPRTAGELLARDANQMGVLYTKMAQFISARSDALDKDFIEALSAVQDRCGEEGAQGGDAPADLPGIQGFWVDPVPLASASIAVVHVAKRSSDGAVVVIKRRRAGVRERIQQDVPLLKTVLKAAGGVGVPGALNMHDLVRESEGMLLGELDFKEEARAAEEFRERMAGVPWLVVPRVYAARDDCLVMEYVPSQKLARVKTPNAALAERLMDLYMFMVKEGFVHADLHPGNLGFLEDGRIVLYDFGAMLRIGEGVDMSVSVARALQAVVTKDAQGLLDALETVGVVAVDTGQRSTVRRVLRKALRGQVHTELQNTPEFVDSKRRVVRFGTAFVYLARTLSLVTSACLTLDPEFKYDYAQWIPGSGALGTVVQATSAVLRDAAAMPATMLTMQSDMEEFQVRIMEEMEAAKKATRVAVAAVCVAGAAVALSTFTPIR